MSTVSAPDDTEIHIPDDAPAAADADIAVPADAAPATGAATAKPAILDPDEGIAKLQRQLEAEKTARAASDQRAREAEAARMRAQSENQDSQLHMVTTAIASVTQALDVGEQQLADAWAQNDPARAAKIQREMSQNAAKLQKLEDGKQQLEARAKAPPRVERAADPVEALAANLAPRAANWLRSHPECATGAMNQKMMAGHYDALSEGHAEGSDAYFQHIETKLGYRQPERRADAEREEEPVEPRAQPRRAAPASAPVSRSGAGAGDRPNVVRLSKDEVEIASMMGMTKEDYAKHKYALKREGKLN